jgi:hypothetical protein
VVLQKGIIVLLYFFKSFNVFFLVEQYEHGAKAVTTDTHGSSGLQYADLYSRLWQIMYSSLYFAIGNDVGRGSYCYHVVKGEFAKAYNLLTAMLGFGFEEQNAGQKARKRKIDKLSSILGFVINIKREVMEQRELLEILWEEVQSGRVNPFGKVLPRKRSLTLSVEDRDEVVYTADSTDDEEAKGSPGRKKQSSKRRKTSQF